MFFSSLNISQRRLRRILPRQLELSEGLMRSGIFCSLPDLHASTLFYHHSCIPRFLSSLSSFIFLSHLFRCKFHGFLSLPVFIPVQTLRLGITIFILWYLFSMRLSFLLSFSSSLFFPILSYSCL